MDIQQLDILINVEF